jgi:hypothetical protein
MACHKSLAEDRVYIVQTWESVLVAADSLLMDWHFRQQENLIPSSIPLSPVSRCPEDFVEGAQAADLPRRVSVKSC